jgi:hypothetical protein
MRLAQFIIFFVGLLFLLTDHRPFRWQLALILLIWSLLAVYLDSSIYGFAEEDGVHFRRYISVQFVPWEHVGRVSWFGENILSIHLRAGSPFGRN